MKALFVIEGNIEDMSVDVGLIAESELEGRKIVRNKLKPHEHKGKSTIDIRGETWIISKGLHKIRRCQRKTLAGIVPPRHGRFIHVFWNICCVNCICFSVFFRWVCLYN